MIIKVIGLDDSVAIFDNVDNIIIEKEHFAQGEGLNEFHEGWGPNTRFFLNPMIYEKASLPKFNYRVVNVYPPKVDNSWSLVFDTLCAVYILNNNGKTIERI